MKMEEQDNGDLLIIIEQKYQDLADCIKSDQLSARQVVQEFEDKKFKKWYRKKMIQ